MIGRVADAFDPRMSVGAPGRSALTSSKPEEFPVSNSKRKGGAPSFPAGALMIGLSKMSGWNVGGIGTGVALSGPPSLVHPAIRRAHPRIARESKGTDTTFLSQLLSFFIVSSPQTEDPPTCVVSIRPSTVHCAEIETNCSSGVHLYQLKVIRDSYQDPSKILVQSSLMGRVSTLKSSVPLPKYNSVDTRGDLRAVSGESAPAPDLLEPFLLISALFLPSRRRITFETDQPQGISSTVISGHLECFF